MSKNAKVINSVGDSVTKIANRAIAQSAKKIKKEMPDIIKDRTEKGFGVDGDGKKRRFNKRLDKKTIAQRKRYSRNLSSRTSSGKQISHGISTGQLIEAIKAIGSGKKIQLTLRDKRRKTLSGGTPSIGNQELIEYVEDYLGLEILALSNKETRDIEDQVIKAINKALARVVD